MNGAPPGIHILDIDGTLMPSHEVDNRCYWQAVNEIFNTPQGTLELHQFRNVTDNGILAEWCERTLGRGPRGAELIGVRSRFLELLETAAEQQPAAFVAFAGAQEWLALQPTGSVALATGGWEHTARFKLECAGLDRFQLVLASSDQAASRPAIMRHALDMLGVPESLLQRATPPGVTYIGDGPWDYTAASVLGWGFIGIASGQRAAALEQAGAQKVYADFRPLLV